jgi:hypothetical protein
MKDKELKIGKIEDSHTILPIHNKIQWHTTVTENTHFIC